MSKMRKIPVSSTFAPSSQGSSSVTGENWPAFAGLLAAFVLVLFLVLLFFSIQYRTAELKIWTSSKNYREKIESYEQNKQQIQHLQTSLRQQHKRLQLERKANQSLLAGLQKLEKRLNEDDDVEDDIKKLLEQIKREQATLQKERKKLEQQQKPSLQPKERATRVKGIRP